MQLAAKRRKNTARGASRGNKVEKGSSPEGAKDWDEDCGDTLG